MCVSCRPAQAHDCCQICRFGSLPGGVCDDLPWPGGTGIDDVGGQDLAFAIAKEIYLLAPTELMSNMDVQLGPRGLTRRQFHVLGGAAASSFVASGCGTLLYPERIGQPRTGPVDWGVVGMDCIGLLFFFVPGVIAFAVDIYNGTLFHTAEYAPATGETLFSRVDLLRRRPPLNVIAVAVSNATGRRVTLEQGTFLTRPLNSLQQFPFVQEELLAQYDQGDLVYRCQSPG